MDYEAIRRGECPALGEGKEHAWVSSGDRWGCPGCGVRIPAPTSSSTSRSGGGLREEIAAGWRVESQTETEAVLVKGSNTNHILHLLLAVFTVGLWIPVWIIVALTSGEQRKVVSTTARDPNDPARGG